MVLLLIILFEIINKHFSSLLTRYQIVLETSVKGSDFVFDSIDGIYYKYHRINVNRDRLYLNAPDWKKQNKKVTINPKNNDDNYFQYAVTVTLNHKILKLVP